MQTEKLENDLRIPSGLFPKEHKKESREQTLFCHGYRINPSKVTFFFFF